ncbi:MAG: hypothetical protein QN137_13510 [Armatimonadota bacterium]|nr:hypothetical protein [Armatimonadota bacterium]
MLGILIGATIYSEVYGWLQPTLLQVGVFGKLTLPALLGVNPWVVIPLVVAGLVAVAVWVDKKGL